MAYTLPDWLVLNKSLLREGSGLTPDQLQATADNDAMETTIEAHISVMAARVLGEARTAAGARSFPSTDAELQKAFPVEVEFPVIVEWTASQCARQAALDIVKADAYELWVPSYVSLKFPFVIGDPDDATHGQVTPAQEAITAATDAAATERANRIEEQKQLVMEAVTSFVYAKLWYTVLNPGDDYKTIADGHWKNAMSLVSTLKANISQIRNAYQLHSCPFV